MFWHPEQKPLNWAEKLFSPNFNVTGHEINKGFVSSVPFDEKDLHTPRIVVEKVETFDLDGKLKSDQAKLCIRESVMIPWEQERNWSNVCFGCLGSLVHQENRLSLLF